MRGPFPITGILLGLILIPTCVLGWMGFQSADALDAADGAQLQRDLEQGAAWATARARELAAAHDQAIQHALEQAAAELLDRLPNVPRTRMRAEIDAAVTRAGRASRNGRNARLSTREGVVLFPVPHEPDEAAQREEAPGLGQLFRDLRRDADRAFYTGGGPEAATRVWEQARTRLRAPLSRATADVEIARLRARAERAGGARREYDAVCAAWSQRMRAEIGRPWVLLALAAAAATSATAPREELGWLVREGYVDSMPLTAAERITVIKYAGSHAEAPGWQGLPRRLWQHPEGLVSYAAPVHGDVRLEIDMPVCTWRDALFGPLASSGRAAGFDHLRFSVLDDAAAARWAPGGSRHAERVVDGVPGTTTIEIAAPRGFRTTIAIGHALRGAIIEKRKSRRRLILIAVAALVLVTLTGLLLTRRAIRRERQARRMRDEFVANVTHEVRTPLTSVLLHSQLMADEDAPDDKRREHAEVVQAQGRRLAVLVDDMLDFARLERGTRTLEAVPLDVGAACREAVAPYLVLAEQEGVDVRCEIDGDEVPAMADPAALARILGNLVGNAWKHGRPARAGGAGRIRVTAWEDGTGAVVEVRDDGPGIPAEERERIFERFGRGRRAQRIEGSGIGLALSHDLARALSGSLCVEDDGSETIFRLRLPAVPDFELEA